MPSPDTLQELAEAIEHLDYVVQRNWHNLPQSLEVNGHADLDLFTSDQDKQGVREIAEMYLDKSLVDVFSLEDMYLPVPIARNMLINTRRHGGFKIPSASSYFLSLYYHNLVHKNNNPYEDELKEAFYEWMPPVRCVDKGVGYYARNTIDS